MDWTIETIDRIESTQLYLHKKLEDDPVLKTGYVVQALQQTAGKGRHDRQWQQGEGNLYFSFLIREKIDLNKIGQISLLSGLSLAKTVAYFCPMKVKPLLKWPNDVLIKRKKCAGILIETSPQTNNLITDYIIIGIGVNIKSAPLETSSKINDYSYQDVPPKEFMQYYLNIFSTYMDRWSYCGFEEIHEDWCKYSFRKNDRLTIKQGERHISGKFESVDKEGNLFIICDQSKERKVITSGDIFLANEE